MAKKVALSDLRSAKRVLKYMKKDIQSDDGWKDSPTMETANHMIDVFIRYTDNLADEIREGKEVE